MADRVYGLVSWPVKTDKHGELVRKYCEFRALRSNHPTVADGQVQS